MSKPQRLFESRMKKKITLPKTSYGVLGNLSGIVSVPNKNNFVYVRLQDGLVTTVFNTRVPPTYGTPVVIGVDPLDPGLPQVLSIRSSLNDASGMTLPSSGYAPAKRYRWMAEGGGQDPLFSELRQIMPLRMYSSSGLNVDVYPGFFYTKSGTLVQVAHQTVDLTASVPATASSAIFILISLDNTGALVATAGTEVLYEDLALTDIPEPPANAEVVLGAIRLYTGQTVIQEGRSNTDIVDLRFPIFHMHDVEWKDILNKPAIYRGVLYLHDEASGIGTYESLLEIPANTAEDEDSQVVNSASGEVLIDGYITEVLNTNNIPDGLWEFHTFCKVSSAVGVSEIVIRVYKRDSGGTETELFNLSTGEINETDITEMTVESVQETFNVDATDRLLVKYFAKTNAVTNKTIYLYYEGTEHYSHIHVPFSFGEISNDYMKKSEYDTDRDGIVDEAAAIEGIGSTGNSKYYGTDESGTAGFHDIPNAGISVQEVDGTPNVSGVTTVKVTNGTLTDNEDGSVTLDFGSAATDGAAIHDNVADEISAITEKTELVDDDLFIIEDSEASGVKKKVKYSNVSSGGSGGADILEVQVFS